MWGKGNADSLKEGEDWLLTFHQQWWHLEGREMSSSLQQRNNHYPEILY